MTFCVDSQQKYSLVLQIWPGLDIPLLRLLSACQRPGDSVPLGQIERHIMHCIMVCIGFRALHHGSSKFLLAEHLKAPENIFSSWIKDIFPTQG